MTSLEDKVSELTGKVLVLEKLVMKVVTESILDCRVQSLNAERVANHALSIASGAGSGATFEEDGFSMEGAGDTRIDIRNGGLVTASKAAKKED